MLDLSSFKEESTFSPRSMVTKIYSYNECLLMQSQFKKLKMYFYVMKEIREILIGQDNKSRNP